jgi:hypothetical protein
MFGLQTVAHRVRGAHCDRSEYKLGFIYCALRSSHKLGRQICIFALTEQKICHKQEIETVLASRGFEHVEQQDGIRMFVRYSTSNREEFQTRRSKGYDCASLAR